MFIWFVGVFVTLMCRDHIPFELLVVQLFSFHIFQSEKSFDKLDKLDQNDLYTMYKKLQQQLEFLNVQEEYIKVCNNCIDHQ